MSTSVGTTQEQLGFLFDAVAEADRVIARDFAARSTAIDEARRFSEAHAGEIPLSPRSRWVRDEIASRELSSELAATLHLTTGAELVQSIFARANDIAASLQGQDKQQEHGKQRTLTQLRTDVPSDLLIDGVTPSRWDETATRCPNGCAGSCGSETRPAVSPGATNRRMAPTSTTPTSGISSAKPLSTTSRTCAKPTTPSNQRPGGRWPRRRAPGGILTWTSPTGRDFVTEPAAAHPTGPPAGDPPPF